MSDRSIDGRYLNAPSQLTLDDRIVAIPVTYHHDVALVHDVQGLGIAQRLKGFGVDT